MKELKESHVKFTVSDEMFLFLVGANGWMCERADA
jgi:hypothetical protein